MCLVAMANVRIPKNIACLSLSCRGPLFHLIVFPPQMLIFLWTEVSRLRLLEMERWELGVKV